MRKQTTLTPALLFSTALALNVLTKGLIGIVFPLGIVLLYLLLTRGPRNTLHRLRQLHPFAATILFFVLATPWHLLIAHANPGHGHPGHLANIHGHWQVPLPTDGNVHGWAWFYFLNEQLYRYLNLRVPHDYDTAPLWLFLGLIAVWLMPWSAFLPSALAQAWPRWRALRTLGPEEKTNLLLLLWAALPLLFFTFSTRQEYYVLPSLPPLILLIARTLALADLFNNRAELSLPSGPATTFVTATATRGPSDSTRAIASGRAASRVATLLLILGTSSPSPPPSSCSKNQSPHPNHRPRHNSSSKTPATTPSPSAIFSTSTPRPSVSFASRSPSPPLRSSPARWPITSSAAEPDPTPPPLPSPPPPSSSSSPPTSACAPSPPPSPRGSLPGQSTPNCTPGDMVAIHGEYEAGSTLGFYLRRNDIHIVEGRSSNLWYGSFFPDAPAIFETRESIARKWQGPQRIFLWQDPQDHDRPPLPLTPIYVIATSGGHQILSNQPSH